MAKVTNISTLLQRVSSLEDLRRFVSSGLDALITQVNGKLDFVDNVRCDGPLTVVFNAAYTTVRVTHGLGRTPIGYLIIQQNGAASVIRPTGTGTVWDDVQIFLQADTTVTVQLFVV